MIAFEVANIRNVPDIPDLVAQMLQISENQIKSNGRAGMTQVRVAINRGAANIHAGKGWVQGLEKLLLPGKGIVYRKFVFHEIVIHRSKLGKVKN
jgi:hypothetical protein